MITKTFEVRDRGTFIPVLAVQLVPVRPKDQFLLARAGYGHSSHHQSQYIFLAKLDGGGGHATCDPYDWPGGARTMAIAHEYIVKHFSELSSGAMIDVQFLLGETQQPKLSEAGED